MTGGPGMPGSPGEEGRPGERSSGQVGGSGGEGGRGGEGGAGEPTGAGGAGGEGGHGGVGQSAPPRVSRSRRRLAAYLLVVGVFAYGIWRVEDTVRQQAADRRDDEAVQCVTAWRVREQIREAIPIPAEALIEVVGDAPPDTVVAYREAVARRINEAIDDPDCDLAVAQARLDN